MTTEPAGGLEALQREWLKRAARDVSNDEAVALTECADALAPHIAAAKEMREVLKAAKLLALQTNKPDNDLIELLDELAAILGGDDDGNSLQVR